MFLVKLLSNEDKLERFNDFNIFKDISHENFWHIPWKYIIQPLIKENMETRKIPWFSIIVRRFHSDPYKDSSVEAKKYLCYNIVKKSYVLSKIIIISKRIKKIIKK